MRPGAINNFSAPHTPQTGGILTALARHATERPNEAAAVLLRPDGLPSQAVTHDELHRAVIHTAARLRREVHPGSTVVLQLSNSPEFIVWFTATLAAGLRLLPLHPQLTTAEVSEVCRLTSAAALVVDRPPDSCPCPLIIRHEEAFRRPSPGTVRGAGADLDTLHGELLLQSSGSTGAPKLVVRAAPALEAMAASGTEALELNPDDRVIFAVPMCHSYGVDLLLASLASGAGMVLMPRFDPPALAACLARGGASVFPGVPFMFDALARFSRGAPDARPRLAVSAGSPLPPAVGSRIAETWGVEVRQLYGATELGTVTVARPGDPPATVGAALRGVSLRVLDPEDGDRRLRASHDGQISVRAPTMLSGYYPDLPPPLHDSHLLTGDLGHLDEQGRLYITGRVKLLIDVGGLKVNPLEVEGALNEHPGVRECMVTPVALSETVNRLHAAIVPLDAASPPTEDQLRGFLKERLAPFKIPRAFGFIQQLPRSANGKLLRSHAPREGP